MSEPGAARTILFFHIISARPSKQPRRVRTFLKVHARPRLANPLRCRGTESSTNKQHISLRRLHPTPEEDLDNEGHVIQTCASASAVHERSLSSLLTVPHPGRPESFRLCFRLGPMQLALSHVHPTARKLSFGPEPLAGTRGSGVPDRTLAYGLDLIRSGTPIGTLHPRSRSGGQYQRLNCVDEVLSQGFPVLRFKT
jgi:hypothetical protein